LLRARRLTGHGGYPLGDEGQALLIPARWSSLPALSAEPLEALKERAWRLALAYESLMSTGDAGWLLPVWTEMSALSAEVSARCAAEGLAPAPCSMALYQLGLISQTPWGEAPPEVFPWVSGGVSGGASGAEERSSAEALKANQARWVSHWGALRSWGARRLHSSLKALGSTEQAQATPTTQSVQSAGAWALAAAAVSLPHEQLSAWLTFWRGSASSPLSAQRLAPLKSSGEAERGPLCALWGGALAELALKSGDQREERSLAGLSRELTYEAVSATLKDTGGVRSLTAPLTLWALSAPLSTPRLDAQNLPIAGYPLSYPPRLWRVIGEPLKGKVKPLEDATPARQGMFSKVKVIDRGGRRGMYFVRPSGLEVLESEVDLHHPDLLQVAYTQDFMVAYALVPQLKRALIVGLGGGGMLHALHRYDPQLSLDVVEIDPVVVQLARDYFGVDSTHAQVITRDGFEQLRDPQVGRYDVIYMDAFLQPSEDTDSTGAPLRLKTVAFLREVRERLTPEGALVVNLNEHPQVRRDVRALQEAFPALLLWRVPQTGNLIAVGFNSAERPETPLLFERARRAEGQLKSPVRLTTILRRALGAEGL
jgi:spermidine synthase